MFPFTVQGCNWTSTFCQQNGGGRNALRKIRPNNMKVLISKQIAGRVFNHFSSWCTCVLGPALEEISAISSRMESFEWVSRLTTASRWQLSLRELCSTSALEGAGKMKAATSWMLLCSGYLLLFLQGRFGWGWLSRGTFLLSTCLFSGHCY